MEHNGVAINIDKSLNASTYKVWTLDSYEDWVPISGSHLSKNDELILQHAAWPELSLIENHSYVTRYDPHTGSQLFVLEGPDSIVVRASIPSSRMLSSLECEFVAKSVEEANKSLAYHLSKKIPGIMSYTDIGINRFFLNQETEEIEQFIHDMLSPLRTPKAQASEHCYNNMQSCYTRLICLYHNSP